MKELFWTKRLVHNFSLKQKTMKKIHARLQTTPADTLIVMNEKNMPIHYGYSKDSSRIVFRVPLIRKKSQKTYSVNRKDMSLSDNLFRFRSENIYIDVK